MPAGPPPTMQHCACAPASSATPGPRHGDRLRWWIATRRRKLAKVASTTTKEDSMSKETHRSGTRPASTSYAEANPQLYSFLDWMAQQDADYSQAFRQYA